jgi:hypothetical protein
VYCRPNIEGLSKLINNTVSSIRICIEKKAVSTEQIGDLIYDCGIYLNDSDLLGSDEDIHTSSSESSGEGVTETDVRGPFDKFVDSPYYSKWNFVKV